MTLPVLKRQGTPRQWDPFRGLDEFYDRFSKTVGFGASDALDRWIPLADLEETDDAYVVEVELPGLGDEDVDVQLDDRVLTVSGEIQEKKRTGILHRRTRKVGRFDYTVMLPGELDDDHVDASLRNGVLTVRVPKSPQTRRRRIEITR
jgi:HSP20 family protein